MTPFTPPGIDWIGLSPVVIVLGAGVVGMLVEAFVGRRHRRIVQLVLALAATAVAFLAVAYLWADVVAGPDAPGGRTLVGGAYLVDGPALFAQGTIAVLAFLGLLVIADRTSLREDAFAPQAAAVPGTEYEDQVRRAGLVQTEVYPLVMFAVGGMMVFPAAGDLLTMFIALEVLSLPLYLLAGLARRRRLLSQEASLKYFLLGAFASAFFLFGTALLYGFAGSVALTDISRAILLTSGLDGLLIAGVLLVLVGLLFKVGAAPFHAWTPDVYQGAPSPITGFMAACTKVAAFGAILRLVYVVMPGLEWDFKALTWGVAILTIAVGTVLALVQTDVKRMLAYSSIAHAGFLLVGVFSLVQEGISSVLFYLVAYGLATIGAFGVVTLVRERDAEGNVIGEATHIAQWAGLGRRNPGLAVAFTVFLLSFAGIPLTAGFIGKFAVFSAAAAGDAVPLVVIGVLASAVAAFFYVRLIVLMFFTAPEGDSTTVVASEGLSAVAIGITAAATIVLGVLPGPVLALATEAARFLP
jgi:NADH-quinone oxidoreductase subunit N